LILFLGKFLLEEFDDCVSHAVRMSLDMRVGGLQGDYDLLVMLTWYKEMLVITEEFVGTLRRAELESGRVGLFARAVDEVANHGYLCRHVHC
jgi:hypothetical protein